MSLDFAFMLIFEAAGRPLYAAGGAVLALLITLAIAKSIKSEFTSMD